FQIRLESQLLAPLSNTGGFVVSFGVNERRQERPMRFTRLIVVLVVRVREPAKAPDRVLIVAALERLFAPRERQRKERVKRGVKEREQGKPDKNRIEPEQKRRHPFGRAKIFSQEQYERRE